MALHSPGIFYAERPAAFDGKFHWDRISIAIQAATGRKITPMDIDCNVEIKGQHLIYETKKIGVEVPDGQRRALESLWAKGYFCIVIQWGKKYPVDVEIWYPGGKVRKRAAFSADEMDTFVANWASWANRNPCPFQFGPEDCVAQLPIGPSGGQS